MGVYKELFWEIEHLADERDWRRPSNHLQLAGCKDTPENRAKCMAVINQLKEMKNETRDIPSLGGFGRQITAWIREAEDYCLGVEIQWHPKTKYSDYGHWEIRTWMCR